MTSVCQPAVIVPRLNNWARFYGLRIGRSVLSTKEQRRQRDEQRKGLHKCIQE